MSDFTYVFFGCGNMGNAVLEGGIKSGILSKETAIIVSKSVKTADSFKIKGYKSYSGDEYPEILSTLESLKKCVWLICVKPQVFDEFCKTISTHKFEPTLIISVMAGITISSIKEKLSATCPSSTPVARLMPNVACAIGAGVTSFAHEGCSAESIEIARRLAGGMGICEEINEKLMDAASVVAGSSPAFAFMFMEALADGAVATGMPRAQALRLAAATMMGSAKLVLESGEHPGQLKDKVCSPGGTTIEGVRLLERQGLRSSVIEAVCATFAKNKTFQK